MLSIHREFQALAAKLNEQHIPYALCGALAPADHGYPRATLEIDLLALSGSSEHILRYGRTCGFTLEAAPMGLAGGTVRIARLSKAVAEIDDVLMRDVLAASQRSKHRCRWRFSNGTACRCGR